MWSIVKWIFSSRTRNIHWQLGHEGRYLLLHRIYHKPQHQRQIKIVLKRGSCQSLLFGKQRLDVYVYAQFLHWTLRTLIKAGISNQIWGVLAKHPATLMLRTAEVCGCTNWWVCVCILALKWTVYVSFSTSSWRTHQSHMFHHSKKTFRGMQIEGYAQWRYSRHRLCPGLTRSL